MAGTVKVVRNIQSQRGFGWWAFAIALSCKVLNDHDYLRHDPVLAVLAGKLSRRRGGCQPLVGKSTLNQFERSAEVGTAASPSRYHRIAHDGRAIERLFLAMFPDAHGRGAE